MALHELHKRNLNVYWGGLTAEILRQGLRSPHDDVRRIALARIATLTDRAVAEDLAARGQPPLVLASAFEIGADAARARFEAAYDDYRDRGADDD